MLRSIIGTEATAETEASPDMTPASGLKSTVTARDKKEVILECETVLASLPKSDIHEGQISLTHGFVPHSEPMTRLPEAYRQWDELSAALPTLLADCNERIVLSKLSVLDASDAKQLPDKYLARAATILGNLAHGYYYNQRTGAEQKADPLPKGILIPWEQVNERIKRRLAHIPAELQASRTNYDTFISNGIVTNPELKIDGDNNVDVEIDDMALQHRATGMDAERVNNSTIFLAELRFGAALKHIIAAVKAAAKKDEKALEVALKSVIRVLESVNEAFDYFSPNEHSKHYADQSAWTKTAARFDGRIPGGHAGLSGSEFPLFHMMDIFIERESFDSPFGKAFAKKFLSLPQSVADFLTAVRNDLKRNSIKEFIISTKNETLANLYDTLLDAYIGEHGLMNIHAIKAYGFLGINFSNGRAETNGGNQGSVLSAGEAQRRIIGEFQKTIRERQSTFHIPYLSATKVETRALGMKAAAVTLDVSKTGIEFRPGDHCAVLPQNSETAIALVVKQFGINPTYSVKLNEKWKHFYQKELGKIIDSIAIGELLKFANLSNIKEFNLDKIEPLTARYYSASPIKDEKQGDAIRLTVGQHAQGVASSHLTNFAGPFYVKKVPARGFHLPKKTKKPVIMFGAGTGISPFMGFINARQKADAGLNWLFLSTTDQESLFYQDELEKAVSNGTLKLSTIFSRGGDVDTVVLDENKKFKATKKYSGKHIDALIKENAEALRKLIVEEGAHVYVCGSTGFSATVRTAIQAALKKENVEEYIDTLIADRRYCVDDYSPKEREEKAPKMYRSEVAMHNKMTDCQVIIEGRVYDLTKFVNVHPGGRKIIHMKAGLDATSDYTFIGHHLDQQVDARLEQYKVGVLSVPTISDHKQLANYEKWLNFLTTLTETQNVLVNNTNFHMKNPPAFLWREVFSVFIDGLIVANFSSAHTAKGSFRYVFGDLLNGLYESADLPKLTFLDEMHQKASQIGLFIRKASTKPEAAEELKRVEGMYKTIVLNAQKFMENMKPLIYDLVRKMEVQGDSFDPKEINATLQLISKEMQTVAGLISHVHKALGLTGKELKDDTEFSLPPTAMMMCPVMGATPRKPAISLAATRNADAVSAGTSRFALMPGKPDAVTKTELKAAGAVEGEPKSPVKQSIGSLRFLRAPSQVSKDERVVILASAVVGTTGQNAKADVVQTVTKAHDSTLSKTVSETEADAEAAKSRVASVAITRAAV